MECPPRLLTCRTDVKEGAASIVVATDCTCQLNQEKDHKVKERESQNGDPNRPNTCPTLMLYRFGYLC